MRRKFVWVLILCLVLMVCLLSTWFLFGWKESTPPLTVSGREPIPATADSQKSSDSADSAVGFEQELQLELPEMPMPEAPSVTEVSTPLQPESEPGLELEPGGSDIIIQDSGDILLPEAP